MKRPRAPTLGGGKNLVKKTMKNFNSSENDLRAIVREEVRAALSPKGRAPQPEAREVLNLEGALRLLDELGVPLTRKTVYNLTTDRAIPYRKNGRRLVFSRRELTAWVDARMVAPSESRKAAALRLAQNANLKR